MAINERNFLEEVYFFLPRLEFESGILTTKQEKRKGLSQAITAASQAWDVPRAQLKKHFKNHESAHIDSYPGPCVLKIWTDTQTGSGKSGGVFEYHPIGANNEQIIKML